MAAAAAAAATQQRQGDPPVTLSSAQDRESWINLNMARFMELITAAYQDGDFSYVKTLLQANHEYMGAFIDERTAQNNQAVNPTESFQILKSIQKMNVLMLATVNRNTYLEEGATRLVTRIEALENDEERMTKLIEAIKAGGSGNRGSTKPVSEYKALQNLKPFTGDRSKFREWNDKLVNALAQVQPQYRDAIKNLNKKLDTLEG